MGAQTQPRFGTEGGRDLPPRRSVTAGRELPPRPMAAAGAGLTLPATPARIVDPVATAVASVQAPPAATLTAPLPAAVALSASRPDPRPMRYVYGASALAAVSVVAVGLVKPDFSSEPTSDAAAPAQSEEAADQPRRDREVEHVVRYVQLRPGQRAPEGATVVSRDELPNRVLRSLSLDSAAGPAGTRNTARDSQDGPGQNAQRSRDRAAPPPARDRDAAPPARDQAAPPPAREPAPPRVTTRQSGG